MLHRNIHVHQRGSVTRRLHRAGNLDVLLHVVSGLRQLQQQFIPFRCADGELTSGGLAAGP
jgi:hypothetical protein